jgi:hypothetical protein
MMRRMNRPFASLVLISLLVLAAATPAEAGGYGTVQGRVAPGTPYGGFRSQWGPKPVWESGWWPRAWWGPNGWEPWGPEATVPAPGIAVWYFCPSAQLFFPDVLDCPEPWELRLPETP